MLKLIRCEFQKLKRKKFILLVFLAAFMFPVPFSYMVTTPSIASRYADKASLFDGLYNMVLEFGVQFLLPCVIGVIAAMLFFMERDNDTFKNIKTIPVSSRQMIIAKIITLFLFGIIFCVATTAATILCGFLTCEVNGVLYKMWFMIVNGILVTAGTLPLVLVIAFFSKNYIFSILLCVFYSVLNLSATALYDVLPRNLFLLLPTPLTMFWGAGNMAKHGMEFNLSEMLQYDLIAPTWRVLVTLGLMAIISILLIDLLYKKRED